MAIERWSSLCEAVGISTRNLNPMDCYMYGGSISRELKNRKVSDLTPQERMGIRDRVLGVVPMVKK